MELSSQQRAKHRQAGLNSSARARAPSFKNIVDLPTGLLDSTTTRKVSKQHYPSK